MRALSLIMLTFAVVLGCNAEMPGTPTDNETDLSVSGGDGGTSDDAATDPGDMLPAMCMPDLAPMVNCGRCGTAMQTCMDGKPSVGACMGEHGECTTGDTIYTADKCQIRVCGKDCQWPGWMRAPGAECSHSEQCNAGVSCPRVGIRDCVKCKLQPCRCPS